MNVLRSFAAIHRALPHTALLLAGEFVSSDLAREFFAESDLVIGVGAGLAPSAAIFCAVTAAALSVLG